MRLKTSTLPHPSPIVNVEQKIMLIGKICSEKSWYYLIILTPCCEMHDKIWCIICTEILISLSSCIPMWLAWLPHVHEGEIDKGLWFFQQLIPLNSVDMVVVFRFLPRFPPSRLYRLCPCLAKTQENCIQRPTSELVYKVTTPAPTTISVGRLNS